MQLLSEYEDPIEYIFFNSSTASRYEQLAEEAVELAHAAQKLARHLRGEQPLADDFDPDKTMENLIEEYADVSLAFDVATGYVIAQDQGEEMTKKLNDYYCDKQDRWVERLKEAEIRKGVVHEHRSEEK